MNPFKIGTIQHADYELMSDLNWHCTKCELHSAQAKTWQVWRQRGIQLDQDENGNYYRKMECSRCGTTTIHRRLKSNAILDETIIRANLPRPLAIRIKEVLKNEEAVFVRAIVPEQLEIDHKFPQIRWAEDEKAYNVSMGEDMIRRKFILLTRSNNLLKSRYCERCKKEGIRGSFPGIDYWYSGDNCWNHETDDENGCIGCFWYDPYKWRESINALIEKYRSVGRSK